MLEEINIERTNSSVIHGDIPSPEEYFEGLNGYVILAIVVGALLFLLIHGTFIHTAVTVCRTVTKQYRLHTLLLCGIYPLVATAAFVTLLVPQSVLICHTIVHMSFMLSVCVLHRLCFIYVNGEENFLKHADADSLILRTPPCCCCCLCFRPMSPTPDRLYILRCMIYQLPVFQFLMMAALNVIYVHEPEIFTNMMLYFAPFMITSILIGLWGLNITVRLTMPSLPDHNLRAKFFCLTMVLLFCKLQYVILDNVLPLVSFGGKYPMSDVVYKQTIIQLLILTEMSVLSFIAKKAYKKPSM